MQSIHIQYIYSGTAALTPGVKFKSNLWQQFEEGPSLFQQDNAPIEPLTSTPSTLSKTSGMNWSARPYPLTSTHFCPPSITNKL